MLPLSSKAHVSDSAFQIAYPEIGVDVLDSSKDSKLVDLSRTLEVVKVVSGFFER